MTRLNDLLSPEQVQAMLDAVDRAYADRAQAEIAHEVRNAEWLAEAGHEDGQALYALVVSDPLFVVEAEREAERNLRAWELADWPQSEPTTEESHP
jgi:hypothetical protein